MSQQAIARDRGRIECNPQTGLLGYDGLAAGHRLEHCKTYLIGRGGRLEIALTDPSQERQLRRRLFGPGQIDNQQLDSGCCGVREKFLRLSRAAETEIRGAIGQKHQPPRTIAVARITFARITAISTAGGCQGRFERPIRLHGALQRQRRIAEKTREMFSRSARSMTISAWLSSMTTVSRSCSKCSDRSTAPPRQVQAAGAAMLAEVSTATVTLVAGCVPCRSGPACTPICSIRKPGSPKGEGPAAVRIATAEPSRRGKAIVDRCQEFSIRISDGTGKRPSRSERHVTSKLPRSVTSGTQQRSQIGMRRRRSERVIAMLEQKQHVVAGHQRRHNAMRST